MIHGGQKGPFEVRILRTRPDGLSSDPTLRAGPQFPRCLQRGMNSNSYEVKKTLESDLSGPRKPGFSPVSCCLSHDVSKSPRFLLDFLCGAVEPMASGSEDPAIWPRRPGMLERHQVDRRVSRADVRPCSLSKIPSGFAGLQGEFILQ
jgi:hypothetical protein